MQLHPTLTTILTLPADPVTSAELADAVGLHESTIARAVQAGKIEGLLINMRGHGKTMRYRITKAAAVRWLWNNTNQDRTLLRAAMETECPKLLKLIESQPVTNASEPEPKARPSRAAKAHSNVIPFDERCDLFPELRPTTSAAA